MNARLRAAGAAVVVVDGAFVIVGNHKALAMVIQPDARVAGVAVACGDGVESSRVRRERIPRITLRRNLPSFACGECVGATEARRTIEFPMVGSGVIATLMDKNTVHIQPISAGRIDAIAVPIVHREHHTRARINTDRSALVIAALDEVSSTVRQKKRPQYALS